MRTTKKFHFLLLFSIFLAESRKLEPLYIVNSLTVTKNSYSKLRLILDLRHVNFFCLIVYKDRTKFDGWRKYSILWTTKVFLYNFDMTKGYNFTKILEKGRDKNLHIFWRRFLSRLPTQFSLQSLPPKISNKSRHSRGTFLALSFILASFFI